MSNAGSQDVIHWNNSDMVLPNEGQRIVFDGLRGNWLNGTFIGGKFVRDPDPTLGEKTRQVCDFMPSHWRPEVVA